ncbi:MAG: hypothetical protein AB1742_14840 [bacterium]
MDEGKQIVSNNKTYLLTILVFAVTILLTSCGGGSSAPTGSLNGQVQVPEGFNPKAAARTAGKGLMGAAVTAYSTTVTADADGNFTFASLPVANCTEIAAASGAIQLKMYADITAGSNSKNINSTTTAAAVIYEKLVSLNMAAPAIGTVEGSALITPLKTEIGNALLQPQSYSYASFADSQNTADVIARINAGASFSDTTAPAITITYPANGSQATDSKFVDASFAIQFTYSDSESVPDSVGSPIAATIQLDGGNPVTITNYFATPTVATQFEQQSSSLAEITGSLIDITTNVTTRTATITLSMTDISGNTGTGISTFTIIPDVGPPPEKAAK